MNKFNTTMARGILIGIATLQSCLMCAQAVECLEGDFVSLSGWRPLTSGRFGSDGRCVVVADWGGGDSVTAEKPLAVAVGPNDELRFVLNLAVLADPEGRVGSLHALLLDGGNGVVADVGWHDAQAAAGFGGVDFYGEGFKPIYRTDPSGFGKEFATFSGTLEIIRRGAQWMAYVNGKQAGSLTLNPTRAAARVQLTATKSGRWIPPQFQIMGLRVISSTGSGAAAAAPTAAAARPRTSKRPTYEAFALAFDPGAAGKTGSDFQRAVEALRPEPTAKDFLLSLLPGSDALTVAQEAGAMMTLVRNVQWSLLISSTSRDFDFAGKFRAIADLMDRGDTTGAKTEIAGLVRELYRWQVEVKAGISATGMDRGVPQSVRDRLVALITAAIGFLNQEAGAL